jgi:hypothetical protein
VLDAQASTDTFGSAHAVAQLPQWVTSVVSFAQLPEQLVSPAPHVVPHEPAEQTWPPTHAVLHAPQLPLSTCVLTSHPLAGFPSQSANPVAHAPITHVPVAQVVAAFAKLHRIPHPPQLATSLLFVGVSQPFAAAPSQSPYPTAQAPITQLLAEQALTATFASAHAVAHAPQWLTSVVSFAQLPEQFVSPAPHVVPHEPEEQTWPPPHAALHAPQLPLSACVFTSHPFAGLPSQSAKPAAHAPITQPPVAQVAAAFAKLHLSPQPPQLPTSVLLVAVSQPFVATPSQSPNPAAHAPTTQLLAEHASTAVFGRAHEVAQLPQWLTSVVSSAQLPEQLVSPAPHVVPHAPAEHTWPPPQAFLHAPQFPLSAWVFVSHPLDGSPSQSAKPTLHAPSAHTPVEHVAPAFA